MPRPNAQLKRARQFSQAIAAVSSTSCSSLKCACIRSNSSSGTSVGVREIASAYSSTSLSFSSSRSLACQSIRSFSSSSDSPDWRAIIEPMSTQNSQPTTIAARSSPSAL